MTFLDIADMRGVCSSLIVHEPIIFLLAVLRVCSEGFGTDCKV